LNLELAAIHEEDCDLNLLGVLEAQEAVPSLTDENDTLQVQPDPVARSGDLFGPGAIASSVPTVPVPDAIVRLLGWIEFDSEWREPCRSERPRSRTI
jgi:hypothetical protein